MAGMGEPVGHRYSGHRDKVESGPISVLLGQDLPAERWSWATTGRSRDSSPHPHDGTRRFCQLNPAEAKAIARRNHLSISLDTGHLLPRRKGAATQESIVRCPQQMSADAKQIVNLPMDTQKPLRLS